MRHGHQLLMVVLLGQMVLLELEVKDPQGQLVKGPLEPQEMTGPREAQGPQD
jgi:hypothetical protein